MDLRLISHQLLLGDLLSLSRVSRNFYRSIRTIYCESLNWIDYSLHQKTRPLYTPVTVTDWRTYYTIEAFLTTKSPLLPCAFNKESFERLAETEYDTATIHYVRQQWLLAAIDYGYNPDKLEPFGDKKMPATIELYRSVLKRRDMLLWHWFRDNIRFDLASLEAAFCDSTMAQLYHEWVKRDASIRSLNKTRILSYYN